MSNLGGGNSGNSHGGGQGIAGQLLGGLTHSGGQGHSSGGSSGLGGKLVGQLASSLFSSGNKPSQPQNYHSSQSESSHQSGGGLAGSVMGGVASMFGGKQHGQSVCCNGSFVGIKWPRGARMG